MIFPLSCVRKIGNYSSIKFCGHVRWLFSTECVDEISHCVLLIDQFNLIVSVVVYEPERSNKNRIRYWNKSFYNGNLVYSHCPTSSSSVRVELNSWSVDSTNCIKRTNGLAENILKIDSQSENNNHKHWKAKHVIMMMPFQGRESDISLHWF